MQECFEQFGSQDDYLKLRERGLKAVLFFQEILQEAEAAAKLHQSGQGQPSSHSAGLRLKYCDLSELGVKVLSGLVVSLNDQGQLIQAVRLFTGQILRAKLLQNELRHGSSDQKTAELKDTYLLSLSRKLFLFNLIVNYHGYKQNQAKWRALEDIVKLNLSGQQ